MKSFHPGAIKTIMLPATVLKGTGRQAEGTKNNIPEALISPGLRCYFCPPRHMIKLSHPVPSSETRIQEEEELGDNRRDLLEPSSTEGQKAAQGEYWEVSKVGQVRFTGPGPSALSQSRPCVRWATLRVFLCDLWPSLSQAPSGSR